MTRPETLERAAQGGGGRYAGQANNGSCFHGMTGVRDCWKEAKPSHGKIRVAHDRLTPFLQFNQDRQRRVSENLQQIFKN